MLPCEHHCDLTDLNYGDPNVVCRECGRTWVLLEPNPAKKLYQHKWWVTCNYPPSVDPKTGKSDTLRCQVSVCPRISQQKEATAWV